MPFKSQAQDLYTPVKITLLNKRAKKAKALEEMYSWVDFKAFIITSTPAIDLSM